MFLEPIRLIKPIPPMSKPVVVERDSRWYVEHNIGSMRYPNREAAEDALRLYEPGPDPVDRLFDALTKALS